MIYYIADLHFGHKNVLRFDNRPFADTDLMNEVMIQNWNACVKEEDTVYVLGDAFWKNEEESIRIMHRLNGHKHLILGNHDRVCGRLRFHWESIEPYAEIKDGDTLVILSHYPTMFYKNQHYGAVMLYGHVHNTEEWQLIEKWNHDLWERGIPSRMINVGCMMEYMGYTPRTLAELLRANPMPSFEIDGQDEEEQSDTVGEGETIQMRKLASVQKIWKIEPIEGADRIELAHVLGWQCVVNKDQFQPMDIGVYFEIDSFLPIRPEFEFLRSSSYKNTDIMGEGFRLRTMRFRGQISQGLLLPLDRFPEIPAGAAVGDDVTEILKVRKWEIEERATTGGTVVGTLPYDIPHTDETRVQEEPALIQAFAGLEYYISTKMDGSSHSIGVDENGFHVTGHNYEYKDDGSSSFFELVKARRYQEKVEAFAKKEGLKTLTIQGELCAPGIQKNRLRLTKPEWYVFTVRENGERVGLRRMLEVCEALGFNTVPIEEVDTDLPAKYPTVEALLDRADGEYPNGGKKEGIVVRPTEPVFCPLISASLSMKIVSNKYLLKNEGQ